MCVCVCVRYFSLDSKNLGGGGSDIWGLVLFVYVCVSKRKSYL